MFAYALAENSPTDPVRVLVAPSSSLRTDQPDDHSQTMPNLRLVYIDEPELDGLIAKMFDSLAKVSSYFRSESLALRIKKIRWAFAVYRYIAGSELDATSTVITMSKPYEDHMAGYLLQ